MNGERENNLCEDFVSEEMRRGEECVAEEGGHEGAIGEMEETDVNKREEIRMTEQR